MLFFLTRFDVAERLGISTVTVDRLIRSAGLPVVRIGRSVRIPEEAFYSWLEAQGGEVVTK